MALINTIQEVKKYIAVNISTEMDTIMPYIRQAETKFIKPIIGKELLKELDTYSQGSSSDEKKDKLLNLVRNPLIHYAYHLYAPIGAVNISDAGIRIATDDNMKTAFEWQVDKVERSFLNTAHDFIEDVLEYLEDNRADFESWSTSEAFTLSHDMLINSARQFNEVFNINNSRRLFVALRPIIKNVERRYIIPTISKQLYTEIIESFQNSEGLSDDNETLLNLIQAPLAKYTIARAISELSLEILPEGVFENAVQVVSKAKQSAGRDKLSVLIQDLTADAGADLTELQQYLDDNASSEKYQAYFNSALYVKPSADTVRGEFTNSKGSTIYFP